MSLGARLRHPDTLGKTRTQSYIRFRAYISLILPRVGAFRDALGVTVSVLA